MPLTVLLVDDDDSTLRLLAATLAGQGFTPRQAATASEALGILSREPIDVVVSDVAMEELDGLRLCARILAQWPSLPVILLTASDDLATAVEAMRAGAHDYVVKPAEGPRLVEAIHHAHANRRVALIPSIEPAADETMGFGELIGSSPPMMRIYRLLARVADLDSSVLITGESGTGKELVARALHHQSRRVAAPFVAVNCAAIPDNLIESELFGHVKGAFTDAHRERRGLFSEADGGTIFLDEIGDLPLALQPKLLRALQERRVRPVGGTAEISFDARFVAATNRDLRAAVQTGAFREDLYFRLAVIQAELPALRHRGDDILLLASRLTARFALAAGKPIDGMAPAVADRLRAYAWPGNVRELENCLERAVALSRYRVLTLDDLPQAIRDAGSHDTAGSAPAPPLISLDELERRHVHAVLDAFGRNASRTARLLGIDRKTLGRKLRQWEAMDRTAERSAGRD